MEAARNTWTDDRIDELAVRVDDGFARSEERDRELSKETKAQGSELRAEITALATELRGGQQEPGNELRSEIEGVRKDLSGEVKGSGEISASPSRGDDHLPKRNSR
jgi:hypothetical protein